MASRREFTFGSMILALTGARAARASIPELQAETADLPPQRSDWIDPPRRSQAPRIDVDFAVSRFDQRLQVTTTVTNRHREPVEVLVLRGSSPGPFLTVAIHIDGERFELPQVYQGDRRAFLSRAGPIPHWQSLAVHEAVAIAPHLFEWPAGVPDLPVALKVEVQVAGFSIERSRTLRLGGAKRS